MVSVLDVLRQPVLGPVDGLTVDGCLHVVEDDKELVMLHLVINTVEVLNVAESGLLIVKVELHVLLHLVKNFLALGVLRDLKDVGKEDVVLTVDSGIVSGEGLVPDVGLRYLMLQMSLVAEVSVLDVLHQPVLGPLELVDVYGGGNLVEPRAENDVLLLVLLAVVPGEVKGVTEFLLFGVEMVSHKVLKFVNEVLIVEVALNGQHGLEKSDVFGVHLDVLQETKKIN